MRQSRHRHVFALLAACSLAAAPGVFAQSEATAPPLGAPGASACATPPCGPGAAPQPSHPSPHHVPGARMRHLDADRDGQVSREELLAAQRRQLERFDQADRNQDGVLSAEERRAWRGGPGARPACAPAARSG